MKKLALSMILGASLMVTSSAFALTSMTDSNMKAATGQAGVSIAVDNVVIESYTGETLYTDDDGFNIPSLNITDAVGSTSLVISGKHVTKRFLAMTSAQDYTDTFAALTGTTASNGAAWAAMGGAKALTIDVGTCLTLTAGWQANNANTETIAGVVIGLPTLIINTTGDTQSYGIRNASAHNSDDNYITITKTASTTAILSGIIEIAPH